MSIHKAINLHPVLPPETEALIPILQAADEGEERIRTTLTDDIHVSYAALDGEDLIGAATLRWGEESELVYIAVAPGLRGRGYGRAIIELLLVEARLRNVRSLLVGTANSSLENIAFYQKCGFRLDHVRPDYFAYIQPPIVENGILMRDMIVLRYALEAEKR